MGPDSGLLPNLAIALLSQGQGQERQLEAPVLFPCFFALSSYISFDYFVTLR